MEKITGNASFTLEDVKVKPAGAPHTYLGVAEGLMPGIHALVPGYPSTALALSLICAHTLECLLKAYLSRGGSDAACTDRRIRHNLNALWGKALSEGLPIQNPAPDWVSRLSGLHQKPYYLRYATKIHGIVLPAAEPMASELQAVLQVVRAHLN